MSPKITASVFGITPQGDEVELFKLSIPNQIEVRVMNYGATWTTFVPPDRNGKMEDVLLGFDTLEGFFQKIIWIITVI
jgi:aldose 1-epimerase